MGEESTISPIITSSFRGLNTKLSDISLSEREATSLNNIHLTRETLDIRGGSSLFTTTQLIEGGAAKAVTGIYQAVLGTTIYRVVTGGTKIYSCSSAGVLSDITGAVTITENKNNLFSFEKFVDNSGNDIIIAMNGIDPPIKWTGTGNVSALSGVPVNFKFGLVNKNRFWATYGDFLYHTDLLDGETYDALYWVARFKTTGLSTSDMTGLKKFGDTIAIFKEDAIILWSGESIPYGEPQYVVSGDGCISGYSIAEVFSQRYGQILVFMNRNHELKGFNGSKDLIPISWPIDNTLNAYSSTRKFYTSGVYYKKRNEYLCTATASGSGLIHDKFIGYDSYLDLFSQGETNESTMLLFSGISPNFISIMDYAGFETAFVGTYDGWVLIWDDNVATDVTKASQIAASPTGAIRATNVVTITTSAPHDLSAGDSVVVAVTTIATGSGSFDGTFTVASTPTTTSFTYAQTAADATGGAGIVKVTSEITAHWQSKKFNAGNAAFQKQINDFSVVTASTQTGSIKATVYTEKVQAQKTFTVAPAGSIYGQAQYGANQYGGGGVTYSTVILDTGSGVDSLVGRYFRVRFDNVNGFRFSLEEFILGVTSHGYQKEYVVA